MDSKLGSNPSYIWRSILWGREGIEVGSRWRIGDGKNVSIYHHRWLPRPSTFKPFSPPLLPSQSRIAILIDENGCWKEHLIRNNFLEDDADQILKLPLPKRPLEDQLVWSYDKRDQYQVKSGYYVALRLKLKDLPSSSSPNIGEPHAIVARAANAVNSYRDNVLQRGTNKSINPKTPSPGWQSPPLPWYKVNINAAVSSKEARAGIGMLIRNSQGEVMAASNCREISTDNIEFLEALAIQKGIQLAKDIGLVLAITESNSLNVVNLINNKIHNRCEVGWLISNIQEALSSSKSTFQVNHTPRTSSFSSSSSEKTSVSKNVVNSEEFIIEDFNKAIDNWDLPKTDMSKANTVIPKPIQWKYINLPDEWILEGATAPVIPKQLEPNTELQNVTQYSDDFAKAIKEQLDRIEASPSYSSTSKIQIAPDSAQSSKIGVLEQDQSSIASSDIEAFKDESILKTNKIHWELALPNVRTPPDLAIDNRPSALNQSRFNASSVYEWNIDGMSEYNILGLLQQMTMAGNAYKTQSGTSDKAIAEILIAGFTGQLKGGWDHLLTKQQQSNILNSVQIDENGAPILDEIQNPIQDAVATLILTISLHFIGDPSHIRDKNAELLHNLRCRKLSDFQSYKTTFFTRLFLRGDANHTTWKEKFLAGLPTLLGEKVRNSIKTLYDNRSPYDELTYGELVSFVNKEGLKICQDLKLQKRLKWELKKSKEELCSFCKQFNYDPFKTSTSKDCNGKCSSKPYKKHYKSKPFKKPFPDFREPSHKKSTRPYKKPHFSKRKLFKPFKSQQKTPFNYKEATCYKCGQKGHTVKFCRMNKKLHELGLNDEILSKVQTLLIESSNSDSNSSLSGDSDPLQIDELVDSETSGLSDFDSETSLKNINVLTKEQETFLELVKHILDPTLQKEYLDKLLKTLELKDKPETSKVPIVKKNTYDLTEILDKKKTKKLVPNIQDLQTEIKDIKLEIKELKEKQKNDSETIQLLIQKQLQENSDKESEPDNEGFLPPTVKEVKAQETFLTQKSKAQSLLASAKTEDEYFKVMQQLLTTRSETSVASSSSSSSNDAEPFISLGDENEDDCFGIFSPIKH
ncbi:hypothetical protein KPL71_008488 [Citrus sinensis]|uniref:Uncharacterized protein n=1 Tax=Citrus sinensis TaxID=2711 RepID=A0ACB8M791_CITSI|nr:hypothetical protein KPL71_008488 [Citrus sinensis]